MLGVVCILLTIASAVLGLRPLVFQSGSMSPTITTGALAISQRVDASSLEKGQIVSVPTSTGSRVTHRIVGVTHEGDTAILRLRGDANQATDSTPYRVTHADRVLFDVPGVGYAVGWMSGPIGLFLLGLYAAFLLSVLLKRSPEPSSHPLAATGLALVLLGAVASELLVPLRVTPTLAAFTDSSGVSATTLTANLPTPSFSCALSGQNKTLLSWGTVAGAQYVLHYGVGGATADPATTATSKTLNNSSGTAWVVATRSFSGQPWTSGESVHFAYASGVCTAA